MRTECKSALALSAAVMMGIAVGGAANPRSVVYAQAGPAFEISPVLARRPVNGMSRVSRTPQKIAFHAALVGDIMAFAYGLPLDRIERRTQWMYDDRYDVAVTTATPADLPEQKFLLQKLLEERFGLAVHRVSNPSPVYFLVAGTNVHLTETAEVDSTDLAEFRNGVGRHASMSDLAAWLYPRLGLPVLDKTGIAGLFDIEIPRMPIRGGAEGTIRAVQEALGLNLELHPGTAESLIIDEARKPEQN